MGFHELFPVQAALWQQSAGGHSTAHDLCVAAPTGSGKTLAYALPVSNALAPLKGCVFYGCVPLRGACAGDSGWASTSAGVVAVFSKP
jgi:hypothetical protein